MSLDRTQATCAANNGSTTTCAGNQVNSTGCIVTEIVPYLDKLDIFTHISDLRKKYLKVSHSPCYACRPHKSVGKTIHIYFKYLQINSEQ